MMFDDQDGKYDHLTTIPDAPDGDLARRCKDMSRQIEALEGKPQRRYALMQRYRAECQR